MPTVGKIKKSPLGEFTVSFSTASERFYISKVPDCVKEKVNVSYWGNSEMKTWEDVKKKIDDIADEYLFEKLLLRKVIIIQLKTSVSDFKLTKEKMFLTLVKEGDSTTETVTTHDYLSGAEGFHIRWYVAEEYEYRKKDIRYKIIESNKNGNINGTRGNRKVDNIHQLLFESDGEIRILSYREDLHVFLKDLDTKISEMLKGMIAYFDLDTEKFIKNFESTKLNLLGEA